MTKTLEKVIHLNHGQAPAPIEVGDERSKGRAASCVSENEPPELPPKNKMHACWLIDRGTAQDSGAISRGCAAVEESCRSCAPQRGWFRIDPLVRRVRTQGRRSSPIIFSVPAAAVYLASQAKAPSEMLRSVKIEVERAVNRHCVAGSMPEKGGCG